MLGAGNMEGREQDPQHGASRHMTQSKKHRLPAKVQEIFSIRSYNGPGRLRFPHGLLEPGVAQQKFVE